MRAALIAVCTWVLIASGSYLTVEGFLEYREAHAGQDQIAQEWLSQPSQQSSSESSPVTNRSSNSDPTTEVPIKRVPAAPITGAAVARLTFPSLDAVLYVVEGTAARDLKRGPGHLIGTVLPGQNGNCVIAGHRDTHFKILKDIHKGDEVVLERAGQSFRYRVDGMKIVNPQNTASLQPSEKAELNLITCYPFRYVGSAPRRFIVHAVLESSSLEASR